MMIFSSFVISILILLQQMGLSKDEVAFRGSVSDREVSNVVVKFNAMIKLQGGYQIQNTRSFKASIYFDLISVRQRRLRSVVDCR